MQATIELSDGARATAERLASNQNQSLEQYLSAVTEEALESRTLIGGYRNGLPFLRRSEHSRPVTADFVDQLREEIGE